MTGRNEHIQQIDNKTFNILKRMPNIVTEFYYSLTDKQARTKLSYVHELELFFKYLNDINVQMDQKDFYKNVSALVVRKYLESENVKYLKDSTKKIKLAAIKSFFEFLYNERLIDNNSISSIKPPRVYEDKDIVYMDRREINQLKKNIVNGNGLTEISAKMNKKWRERDLAIITLGCNTGLRVSAITEIDLSDIDFDKNVIRVVEKENKIRDIYIGEKTKQILMQWIQKRNKLLIDDSCNALFISNRLQRISVKNVAAIINRYTQNIDKHITPHKLRSTYATNLYEKTGDIFLVQDMLGHSSTETTKKYARVAEGRKRKAASIADMF